MCLTLLRARGCQSATPALLHGTLATSVMHLRCGILAHGFCASRGVWRGDRRRVLVQVQRSVSQLLGPPNVRDRGAPSGSRPAGRRSGEAVGAHGAARSPSRARAAPRCADGCSARHFGRGGRSDVRAAIQRPARLPLGRRRCLAWSHEDGPVSELRTSERCRRPSQRDSRLRAKVWIVERDDPL